MGFWSGRLRRRFAPIASGPGEVDSGAERLADYIVCRFLAQVLAIAQSRRKFSAFFRIFSAFSRIFSAFGKATKRRILATALMRRCASRAPSAPPARRPCPKARSSAGSPFAAAGQPSFAPACAGGRRPRAGPGSWRSRRRAFRPSDGRFGARPRSNCARNKGGQPRSRPTRLMTSAYGSKKASIAASVVSARKPWPLRPRARVSGATPARLPASR